MILVRIICIIIGYAFGLFQTGYIIGKKNNIDIREHGSGNVGMTNALRTLGLRAGALTLAGDAAKAIASIIVVWCIFHSDYPQCVNMLELYAGIGAVLGHNFPFYLKFKGGKGIACTLGVIIAFSPKMVPVCMVLFFLALIITKYVSLGSILILIGFFAQVIIFGSVNLIGIEKEFLLETYIVAALFMILGIIRHKENIKRIFNKTERKFGESENSHKEG